MGKHIFELAMFSECADIMGLPTDEWVVRELLPLESTFTAFDDFPVNKERRYFIQSGKVVCHHPYWPEYAIEGHKPSVENWRELLQELNNETPEEVYNLTGLASEISVEFGNEAWSVDFACDKNGLWWCIDMAAACTSFHWDGCPNQNKDWSN